MSKIKCVRFLLLSVLFLTVLIFFSCAPAFAFIAAAGEIPPQEVINASSDFYFKQAKDFVVDFKVDSKLKDIAFEGNFRLRAPFDFAIEAKSAALEVRVAFKGGDGFIYLPTANIITNLDAVTRAKTKGIQIPATVEQLNERLSKLNDEFELEAVENGGQIMLGGISKTGRGSFKAVIDKASREVRSVATFNKKGVEELLIELKNFKYEPADNKLFEKPQGAIETNLPIPVF